MDESIEYAEEKGFEAIEGAMISSVLGFGQVAIWMAAKDTGVGMARLISLPITAILSFGTVAVIIGTWKETGPLAAGCYAIMASVASSMIFGGIATAAFVFAGAGLAMAAVHKLREESRY